MSNFVQLGLPAPLPYPGGKTRLVHDIIDLLPPHKTYVEPFIGGGSVFWAKEPAKVNVVADMDPQVIAFYRDFSCRRLLPCIANNPPTMTNRRKFIQRHRDGSTNQCDILMARTLSFNAGAGYKSGPSHIVKKKVGGKIVNHCSEFEERLAKTKVIEGDFRSVMKKYNSPSTVVFLDPPYPKVGDRLYKVHGVTAAEVCATARRSKSKVLITYPDTKEVRQACRGLHIKPIKFAYTGTHWATSTRTGRELFIANYPIK